MSGRWLARALFVLAVLVLSACGGGEAAAEEASSTSLPTAQATVQTEEEAPPATATAAPDPVAVPTLPEPSSQEPSGPEPSPPEPSSPARTTGALGQPAESAITPEPDCAGPPSHIRFALEVVDVAPDDVDGGLVVHDSAGVSTPVAGVLPWDAGNVRYVDSSCTVVENGGEWWEITAADLTGWVNSRYLGDRTVAADSFEAAPCSVDTAEPPADQTASSDAVGVTIADIDVTSSEACDRVVITLTQDRSSFDSITSPMPKFPGGLIQDVHLAPAELEVTLNVQSAYPALLGRNRESWLDVATSETNVALVYGRDETTSIYVGWGTGQASVRYLNDPARIVVDIFQTPTDEGSIAGPIVGPAILFDPIQPDLSGPGVTLPITVRGYSWGFESSSSFSIAPWDQTAASHPFEWGGEIFGSAANLTFADVITLEPQLSQWAHGPVFPFTTRGYFEFQITELPVGAYQLAIAPSTGCSGPIAAGQQFRVIDDDTAAQATTAEGFALAVPFSISFTQQYDEAFTSTTVLGEEQTIAVDGFMC